MIEIHMNEGGQSEETHVRKIRESRLVREARELLHKDTWLFGIPATVQPFDITVW